MQPRREEEGPLDPHTPDSNKNRAPNLVGERFVTLAKNVLTLVASLTMDPTNPPSWAELKVRPMAHIRTDDHTNPHTPQNLISYIHS